jgi:hypothetical protein
VGLVDINKVERLAERYFSTSYREDARQDICVALLSGEISETNLDEYIGKLVRRNEGERRRRAVVSEAVLSVMTPQDAERRHVLYSRNEPDRLEVDGQVLRKGQKYLQAARLFREGKSTREVQRIVGLTPVTACKYRKLALKDLTALCGCLKPAGHRGWCAYTLARSPKRQAWLAQWHQGRTTLS